MTPQEKALHRMQKLYGLSAWTENHINFRQVGFRRNGEQFSGIGSNWDEAIKALKAKVK